MTNTAGRLDGAAADTSMDADSTQCIKYNYRACPSRMAGGKHNVRQHDRADRLREFYGEIASDSREHSTLNQLIRQLRQRGHGTPLEYTR